MKKILEMFSISIFIATMLFSTMFFENFVIRMSIIFFMYSFSFFIIKVSDRGK